MFFSLYNIGLCAPGLACCIWCLSQNNIKGSISASGYDTLYQDISKYEIGLSKADQFFGTDFVAREGILLVGNLIDPDHQLEQSGKFILALHTQVPTFKQLFDLYNINLDSLSSDPIGFAEEYFDSILHDSNVLQIIIEDKALMVECEKCMIRDHNRKLKNLLSKGARPELVDLNNLFK